MLTGAVIIKALLMGLLVGATTLAFTQQIILVAISATLTGVFALVVARYTAHENRRLHDRLDTLEQQTKDIAAHTETDRRETDPPAAEAN